MAYLSKTVDEAQSEAVRSTSLLAIGSIGSAATGTDAARAAAASFIEEHSLQEGLIDDVGLLALGNLESKVLAQKVGDSSYVGLPQKRRILAQAVRSVRDPRIDDWILGTLEHDADDGARVAVAESLASSVWGEAVWTAASTAAVKDPSTRVRSALVVAMGQRLAKRPALMATLQEIARQDTSSGVRSLAARQLAAAGAGAP